MCGGCAGCLWDRERCACVLAFVITSKASSKRITLAPGVRRLFLVKCHGGACAEAATASASAATTGEGAIDTLRKIGVESVYREAMAESIAHCCVPVHSRSNTTVCRRAVQAVLDGKTSTLDLEGVKLLKLPHALLQLPLVDRASPVYNATPLMEVCRAKVCQSNLLAATERLVCGFGADPNAANGDALTPLIIASARGRPP